MGRQVCNPCDITINDLFETNQSLVSQNKVYSINGEFTLDQVEVFQEEFSRNIVEDLDRTPLAKLIRRYGFDKVKEASKALNDLVRSQDLTDYNMLSQRADLPQPITDFELAEFCRDNLYNPNTLIAACNNNQPAVLNNLDCFYMGGFLESIMGPFCNTLQNIFGAAGALFDMINKVGDLIEAALGVIGGLTNLLDAAKAAFEKIKVKALLEAIKEKILALIEEAINCALGGIVNFDLESVFGDEEEKPQKTQPAVQDKVQQLKQDAAEPLNEENKKKLLERVEGLIDYAVERFVNPSLEAIEMLVYRFCGFGALIEEAINALKKPLEEFAENAQEVEETVKGNSAAAKAEAVENGAIRLTDEKRLEGINSMRERCRQASRDGAAESVERGGSVTKHNVPAATNDEADGIPTWDELTTGNGAKNLKINTGTRSFREVGPPMWERQISTATKVKLVRLAEAWGETLTINSAHRPKWFNERLRATTSGVAEFSNHITGKAFDIAMSNREKQYEFACLAREHGFGGIGFYNSFIHIDVEAERAWPNSIENRWIRWTKDNWTPSS
jgi:hypothetical protein